MVFGVIELIDDTRLAVNRLYEKQCGICKFGGIERDIHSIVPFGSGWLLLCATKGEPVKVVLPQFWERF